MLKQRLITALALLAILLPAVGVSEAWPFALLTLALVGTAGWEWSRLNGCQPWAAIAGGSVLVAGCAWVGWSILPARVPSVVWWGVSLLWIVGGLISLKAGVAGWPNLWRPARLATGWLALGFCWLAMNEAKAQGVSFILSILVLVWMADVAAYFGGRTWGRHKLASSISPGKTREGVYVGLLAVLALTFAWLSIERALGGSASLMYLLQRHFGGVGLAAAVISLALLGVMGDLLESLVKRSAGVKDSSRLLPGHGGVLDRIDALLPVFPMALALTAW